MTCLTPSALDDIFKDAEVQLPLGRERRGETCLGSLNVSPFDPVKTFQTRLPGLLRSQPELEVGGRDNRSLVLGVSLDPLRAQSLETPSDAGPDQASWADPPPPSSLLPAPPVQPLRRVFKLAGEGEKRGRGGGMGE